MWRHEKNSAFTSVQEEPVPGAFIFCNVVPCVVGQVPDKGDGESRPCIFFAVGAKPGNAKQLIAAVVEFYNLGALVVAASSRFRHQRAGPETSKLKENIG
jgi:hypothetical protein